MNDIIQFILSITIIHQYTDIIMIYHNIITIASRFFRLHAALEPLLRAWTKPGHLVLDVFAGEEHSVFSVRNILCSPHYPLLSR